MTTKEYLSQARYLNMRIDSKLQQVHELNCLATKCTSVWSDMPKSPHSGGSPFENAICKIIDLEKEINDDIDFLVDLKAEIVSVIREVKSPEQQVLLEKRYLCFLSWEQISVDMGYNLRYIHKLHVEALKNCKIPKEDTK